jgi:hypothetical protein
MNTVKLSSIKPNPDNPRVIRDDQFRKLVANIKRYPHFLEKRGIVHADGIILGGNMRYRAIQDALQDAQFRDAIGITHKDEVPACWIQDASDWSAEDRQAFIVLDNAPPGVSGEWDWDLLANQFDAGDLNEWGLEVPVDNEEKEKDTDTDSEDDNMTTCPECGHVF